MSNRGQITLNKNAKETGQFFFTSEERARIIKGRHIKGEDIADLASLLKVSERIWNEPRSH